MHALWQAPGVSHRPTGLLGRMPCLRAFVLASSASEDRVQAKEVCHMNKTHRIADRLAEAGQDVGKHSGTTGWRS